MTKFSELKNFFSARLYATLYKTYQASTITMRKTICCDELKSSSIINRCDSTGFIRTRLTILLVSVFIFLCLPELYSTEAVNGVQDKSKTNSLQNVHTQEFRLNCEPGEQRHFNYESATKVWGSSSQQVFLRATLRLNCMEPANNSTLKYLAEVMSVSGDFGDVISYKKSHQFRRTGEGGGSAELRAEPVLEEVGEAISEAADRVKRSVSGWFTKTWGSVKDFFVTIFSSSEKSTVSREDAFRESGIDISSQCRNGNGKKPPNGLPIDDSVFDDLEPKYYIGAASVDSFRGAATYDFDHDQPMRDGEGTADDESEASISLFDDPKPKSRSKRATTAKGEHQSGEKKKARALSSQYDLDHERLLRLPFVFIQTRQGRVLEVHFSAEESDLSVKNFKRHLCDLFATNLDANKSQTNEVSPIGQHSTKYIVDPTLNSSYIKQSLIKSASIAGSDPTKLLVKALAAQQVAMGPPGKNDAPSIAADWDRFGNSEGRDPASNNNGGGGSLGDSLSVLRSINSTSNLQLNSRTITPDIDQIQVRVKQVQQINEGRIVGSAGQLGMSLVQSGANTATTTRMSRSVDRSSGGGGDDSGGSQQHDDMIADMLKVSTSFTLRLVPASKLGHFNDLTVDGEANGRTVGDRPLAPPTAARTKRSSSSSKGDSSTLTSGSNKEAASSRETNSKKSDNNNRTAASDQKNSTAADEEISSSKSSIYGINNRGNGNNDTATKRLSKRKISREPLVVRPDDQQQIQRILTEWRQLELQLKLSPSSLLPESTGQDGQAQRLEILRDQIQMRLNEEFMRNRLGRGGGGGGAAALARGAAEDGQVAAIVDGKPTEGANLQQPSSKRRNDLGLGLTQLILDTGITAKRKGSVYGTIEEVLELEMALDEDGKEGSVSRLMKDTVRIDKLGSLCRSAIATLEEIRGPLESSGSRVESRSPFGLLDEGESATMNELVLSNERSSRIVHEFQLRNRRKLDQCKQVVQLLLRISDRQAADLVLELIDECNNRMLAGAKHEELGHGPTSRYYRSLRQQFTELMANINRPSEQLLDKLLARLHYSKLEPDTTSNGGKRRVPVIDPQQEFTYVSTSQKSRPTSNEANYNKSLLREEDNFNNNEGAGSLVMTITTLAARPSIGRPKRVEIVEKLLLTLRGSSCSLFNGPDLDILESMGNFHEPLEEMVGKVVHLARRCRHQDQYLVACVHGLQGQLGHGTTQRFLIEQLKSPNSSCTVKSEIVLTLIGAILIDDLRQSTQQPLKLTLINNNQIPQNSPDEPVAANQWPSVGLNQVDDVLLELVDEGSSKNNKNKYAQDRKCLKQLVAYYMSKKRPIANDISKPPVGGGGGAKADKRISRNSKPRTRRAIRNEDQFWDEAQCKRWALPDSGKAPPDGYSFAPATDANGLNTDLLDEIDDNSIILALANNKQAGPRSARRNQKLIEREAELPALINGSRLATDSSILNGSIPIIRRRHKCTASKSFGPKNAEATLKAEIVNDLVGARDENKFLARFRLATNFLGNRIDVGRMYLWHQKHTTRAHVNILGKSLWDTSHGCEDKAPRHLLYMPLFDFNLWLVKVSVGLRLHSEMGFFSNCDSRALGPGSGVASSQPNQTPKQTRPQNREDRSASSESTATNSNGGGQLELYPTMTVRASGEASAKFVVARAGMSLASQYGYQGSIRVSQQPESCMSIYSAHQPMNVTFSSWFQLWDSDCHYWGSRNKAEPQATKWKLLARKPSVWLEDECLTEPKSSSSSSSSSSNNSNSLPAITRSLQTISP